MIDVMIVTILAIFATGIYWNSLDGDFVFDDTSVVNVLMPEIVKHDR